MFARGWDLALCLASSGNASWPSCGYWQTSVSAASCHWYNVLDVQDVTAVHILCILYFDISELITSPWKFT